MLATFRCNNLLRSFWRTTKVFVSSTPRPDLERKCVQIEQETGDAARHFILGFARLDLADEDTYRALLTAFGDRSERFRLWSPHIEF
jgi:hypothetical protein